MRRISAFLLAVLCFSLILVPMGQTAHAAARPVAGRIATQSTPLNVRSQPSTSSAIIGSLPRGSYVTLLDKSGSWWQVQLPGGTTGYCYASYIDEVAGSEAMTIATQWSPLNIRSGPSTSYSILTRLAKGTTVVKLSTSGSFARILYDGTRLGYASLSYLSVQSGTTAATVSNYAAVSLSVNSYKQTDSRWASITVGSTGRTISDIGCATTCLAMTESYRLGYTITPATMESRLNYTSGGAVYWPSAYWVGGPISLDTIYAKLKAGTPVIIGAKNSYGGTHFVVVTGFSGGDGLSTARFTVNDPGSNSRTTLSAFLSAYPSMYRSVYAK